MSARPFRVLGVQQVAIGARDKSALRRLWIDTLGLPLVAEKRMERENVDEDIAAAGVGPFRVEIDLMFVNTDQLVCRASLPDIAIGDRLQISDFGINIPALLFPAPGRYEFRLRMNGRMIAQKDFHVVQVSATPST